VVNWDGHSVSLEIEGDSPIDSSALRVDIQSPRPDRRKRASTLAALIFTTAIVSVAAAAAGVGGGGQESPAVLLHRHALRQVARPVHVGAVEDGDVVRRQLQRNAWPGSG
jgi:hypothetical protein